MRRRLWLRAPLSLILAIPSLSLAQATVDTHWDRLIQDVIPRAPVDPALNPPQAPLRRGRAGDLANHFFFQSRTEYMRQEVSFTGLPTPSGVIDGTFGDFTNPAGFPYPDVFQPNSDHIYQFMNGGTTGWLSPRVNTDFSVRYRQDLSHVADGSPQLSVLNTFRSNRLIEFLAGSVEFHGLETDGAFAGTSLRVGRQYVYGAELAAFDGAAVTVNRPRFSLSLFGGRRFSYYSDPDQRAIGGGSLMFRINDRASLEYSGMAYVKGSHNIAFRNRFGASWLFNTSLKIVGGSAVDYTAQGVYAPPNGRTTAAVRFFQKLSDKDFEYDYTIPARDLDPFNRLSRLYLGKISPYSQVVLDARREITPSVRVGGSVWLRELNDDTDQGPYDASFQDYRVNAQVFAPFHVEAFLELRQRNTDRRDPLEAIAFDDVSVAGETRSQDVRLEFRRAFGEEGRLSLKAGGFYRRSDFQNRFFFIDRAAVRGFTGGAQLKLDDHARLNFDYSLDDDFMVFRPSIQRAQVLQLGLTWRY